MRRKLVSIVLLAFLAGCGGGSHAVPSAPGGTTGTSPSGAHGTATARFTLTIPTQGVRIASKGRVPQYVSASTLSASITATPGNVTTTIDLSPASSLCTTVTGGRACTLPVTAPIGSDTFSMVLYSGACSGGPPCVVSGVPLSAATNFGPISVTEGQTNVTVPLVLGGIPATVDVSAAGFTSGTGATQPLTVTAYDAAGNAIVGPALYVDATGAAAPLSVALGIVPYNGQVALHDGAQNGTTISVAGPTDAPTVALSSPANIIGIPFVVENAAAQILAAHAVQNVAVAGTLTASSPLATTVSYTPDYEIYAPMNVNSGTGLPNGFVLDVGSQSNGGFIGYFNSGSVPESFHVCSVGSQADAGIAPVDGGLAFSYSAGLFTDTNPWGLNFLPLSAFNAGACAAGTPYETDALGTPDSVVRSMAYDPVGHNLFTAGDSAFIQPSGPSVNPSLRYNGFNGSTFTSNTILANNLPQPPTSLIDYRGSRYFLRSDMPTQVFAQTGVSAPTSGAAASTTFASIASGYDGRVYALDTTGKKVYAWTGTGTPALYTASAFSITPGAGPRHFAIGPDGTTFADNGNTTVQNLAATGAPTSVTIPTNSGQGAVDALFDGGNGYVYAVINDGLHAGSIEVVRISH